MTLYESAHAAAKEFGATWRCCECDLALPAPEYDVAKHDAGEVQEVCRLGHWRCCRTCSVLRQDETWATTGAGPMRVCTRCSKERSPLYFEGAAAVCKPCVARSKYRYGMCRKCGQGRKLIDMRAPTGDTDMVCYACAPEDWRYSCTA